MKLKAINSTDVIITVGCFIYILTIRPTLLTFLIKQFIADRTQKYGPARCSLYLDHNGHSIRTK